MAFGTGGRGAAVPQLCAGTQVHQFGVQRDHRGAADHRIAGAVVADVQVQGRIGAKDFTELGHGQFLGVVGADDAVLAEHFLGDSHGQNVVAGLGQRQRDLGQHARRCIHFRGLVQRRHDQDGGRLGCPQRRIVIGCCGGAPGQRHGHGKCQGLDVIGQAHVNSCGP